MKTAFAATLVLLLFGSAPAQAQLFGKKHTAAKPSAPAPCNTPVHAFRNTAIVITINVNATYNPKDLSAGRSYTQSDAIAYLNELGTVDGNKFAPQNGNKNNFTFVYTIGNDGQEHYTGSLDFSYLEHVHLFTTQYTYANPTQMFRDLTAQAYTYIHNGWADTRPECPRY